MGLPRKLLVDPLLTPLYHCTSRCVRRAMLCGPGYEHRKVWIEARLEELVGIFAIEVCGFSVLDNHLHVVVRLDPERVKSWSNLVVAQRWGKLFPPRGPEGQVLELSPAWLESRAADAAWIEKTRQRLASLSWFMKCLKEPLARQANREDKASGAFWAERFRSVAILDEESLLATCAYVDLNPLAAGVAVTPEDSAHTSIHARVEHCRQEGVLTNLVADPMDRSQLDRVAEVEQSHWLCPVEDRRGQGGDRPGLLPGFSLRSYLLLVDWTARLYREGKAQLHRDAVGILERLGTSLERWEGKVLGLLRRSKLVGTALGRLESLERLAKARGQRWVKNLAGRPA
jgi:REP element-mobilizing transposase RayT